MDRLAPCGITSACGGPTFKLSVYVQGFQSTHSSSSSNAKPLINRPFVTLSCGQRTKQSEVGGWDEHEGRWCFNEALTLEVSEASEVCISVLCVQEYSLLVAALDLRPAGVGEANFSVRNVLPELARKETELDGIVHVSPSIGLDLFKAGAKVGRLHLHFEAKNPPTSSFVRVQPQPLSWCGGCRTDDVEKLAMVSASRGALPGFNRELPTPAP